MKIVIEALDDKPVVFTREVVASTASNWFDVLADFDVNHSEATIIRMYWEK